MAFIPLSWINKINKRDKVDASHVNTLAKGINDLGVYTDTELAKINNVIGGGTGEGIQILNTSTPTSINGLIIGNGTNIITPEPYIDWDSASGSNSIKNKPTLLTQISGTGTIPTSVSWSSSPNAQGYYTYSLTATGILATDNIDITRVKNISDSATAKLIQSAWNTICQEAGDVVISDNALTFYSKIRPITAIPIVWKVIR